MKDKKEKTMERISLTCKDSGKFFHDCEDCEHYDSCDYFNKNKRDATMIIVSPQNLRAMKMGLKERTKVRQRREQQRREYYFK